jgi:hypothetical protein
VERELLLLWLLDTAGADPDARGPFGSRPLALPLFRPGPTAVTTAPLRRLLAAGADPSSLPRFWYSIRVPQAALLVLGAHARPSPNRERVLAHGVDMSMLLASAAALHTSPACGRTWTQYVARLPRHAPQRRRGCGEAAVPEREVSDDAMLALVGEAAWAKRKWLLMLRRRARERWEREGYSTTAGEAP